MQLLSVNIGKPQTIPHARSTRQTGIYKKPVQALVQITRTGIPGDAVLDTKHHGGVDQAIYIYGTPDYAWWSQELGQELLPGTFGENLTIGGLESAAFNVGDRLHIGGAILEVTAPRIPCGTLASRMGDPLFVKRFRAAERPGLYCRVIREGQVQALDSVTLEPYAGETVSVLELFRSFYEENQDEATLRRHLAAPIAIRDREEKETKLAALSAQKIQKHQFRAVIQDPGGGGAYVTIPFDVEQVFGARRVKIKATIDGEPYRGTLVRMGAPTHMLLVLKEIRQKIGKSFGDEVEVTLEEDTAPRQVTLPPDLLELLEQNSQAKAAFARLSYTHQKEYVQWIEEARREQTRQKRLVETVAMLLQGKRAR